MLSIGGVSSGSASYYAKDNYYAEQRGDHVIPASEWAGRGAAGLGLSGPVSAEQFASVMSGQVPGGPLLGRMVAGERQHKPGYDPTFSAPKSVSILVEALGDKAAGKAHDAAVRSALGYLERHALKTRVFDPATKAQVETGRQKMVAALFRHDVSRALDPQTHTHAVVANMAQGEDGKWRSVHSPALFDHKMLGGAIYRAELAANLQKLGYAIERTHGDGRFEVAGVPRPLIEAFSTRAADIQAALEGQADTSPEAAARAALITRSAKQDIDCGDLHALWTDKARDTGHPLEQVSEAIVGQSTPQAKLKPDAIIDRALDHLTERSATFTPMALLRAAIGSATGQHRPATMLKAVARAEAAGRLIAREAGGEARMTTPAMVRAERDTIAAMENGRAATDPIAMPRALGDRLARMGLSDEQAAAATHILSSTDRTIGVQGDAGTGKTFMLRGVAAVAEGKGYHVVGLAPSSKATQTLSEATPDVMTLQRFLLVNKADNPPDFSRTFIIVDEASMVSTRQMKDLIDLANSAGVARLVLVGDVKQFDAVEAGTPFEQLQKAGMGTATMSQNRRQRDGDQLDAVNAIAAREVGKAFDKVRSSIIEAPAQDRAGVAADAWLGLSAFDRSRTAIIAQTHAMRRDITAHLRAELKDEGVIGGRSTTIDTLVSQRLTQAQMRDAGSFHAGQTVVFNAGHGDLGVPRGGALTVSETDTESGVVSLFDGNKTKDWSPSEGTGRDVEVFNTRPLEFAEGDQVRWTRNDPEQRFLNSETASIEAIGRTAISFRNAAGERFKVSRDDPALRHLDHGWTHTLHAMQGQTTNHVIAVMDASNPVMTTEKAFYVALSRARDGVTIVTEDAGALKDTLEAQSGVQLSALDVAKDGDMAALEDRETDATDQNMDMADDPGLDRDMEMGM